MSAPARYVIVYDMGTELNLVRFVPMPTLQQLTLGKRLPVNGALAIITERDLPGAINVEFTTEDNLPLLRQVKATTTAALYRDGQGAMVGGYVSSALGTPHTYSSSLLDQQNMTVSVLSSLLPNLDPAWTTLHLCRDEADGIWNFTPHTAAQIQQAGSDGKVFITNLRIRLAQLVADVTAAQDIVTVRQIGW